MERLFLPDWRRVFDQNAIGESVRHITTPKNAGAEPDSARGGTCERH